ncbi:hypothetical protein, partial [Bordetella pertussis]|uniref:hypothetical protein n=1 Tax=Bordetella pertussis TaxID=520 RepID=UPI0038784173
MTRFQRVAVLGSTGSIGDSTLDVIARHPDWWSCPTMRRLRAFAPPGAARPPCPRCGSGRA